MGGIKITQADKWFSLSIREAYDWTRCRCGTQYHTTIRLDCSHGYSRGNWATRLDLVHGQPVWVATVLRAVTGWRLLTDWERERLRELRDDVQLAKMYRKTKGKES